MARLGPYGLFKARLTQAIDTPEKLMAVAVKTKLTTQQLRNYANGSWTPSTMPGGWAVAYALEGITKVQRQTLFDSLYILGRKD